MSYIYYKGKTTAWRWMVIRQQVSDVLAYNQIITTLTKAKETRKHLDKMITLAKKDTLTTKRKAAGFLLATTKFDKKQLLQHLFGSLKQKYKKRSGGYCRILKLGKRNGDNSEMALLQLV